MKEIKAFQCSFCERKIVKTKSAIIRHEKTCLKSPQREACLTCDSFKKYYHTVYNPNHGCEESLSLADALKAAESRLIVREE